MTFVASDLTESQRETLTSSFALRRMNVTAYTFESVRTVFVQLLCTPKSLMEKPSLRVSRHVSSLNRTFIVEDYAEDDFGQWATDEVSKATLMMKDHAFGHGTTKSMPGSPHQ